MKTDFNAETQRTRSNAEMYFSLRPSAPPRLCVKTVSGPQPSTLNPQPSQKGVALIITLILLSVVTFMAITFLALSRRERSAVTTVTDTASARLAADAALANAEAQVVANVLSTTNPYNFSLLVSTNGWPLNFTNLPDNLTNLYVSPRVPVFVANPTNSSLPPDFRYYLDLNRNGRFDGNGLVPETNNLNLPTGITNFMVGDPEWIGVLQRPDQPYGPNNPFVARYAFIALPIGNTLDLNYIHNDATRPDSTMTPGHDGFLRNQGVGSWEINLAAFLTDLNINQWDPLANLYTYATWNGTLYNNGAGFEDALSLLKYRYNGTYNNLDWVQNLYSPLGQSAFQNNIDGYSDGPLMTTLSGTNYFQNVALPWAGADNTNHFFNMQELFNPNEISPTFVNRLLQAGNTNSTYDRYTFYRLLSQLGTDSTPESGKMNINYDNLDLYTNGVAASTNFMAWQPLAFFTNAADRLLRAYTTQWRNSNPTNFAATFYSVTNFNFNESRWTTNYPAFGIGNIPVWVSNRFVYSPAVNRLLQLAGNIYDATTNRYYPLDNGMALPTVFRPIFNKIVTLEATNVYICGFSEVTSIIEGDAPLSEPYNLANPAVLASLAPGIHSGPPGINGAINVFGVPMIIGAKKGFPNFNEFYMESAFQLTRKLMVTRQSTNVPSPAPDPTSSFWGYYEMFNLSLTNQFGVECWNSYRSNYTRPTDIYVNDYLTMTLTNDENNFSYPTNLTASGFLQFPNSINAVWPRYNINSPTPSFQIPLQTNFAAVAVSRYRFNGGSPSLSTNLNLWYETAGPTGFGQYPQPHWGLTTTNNLQVIMVDHNTGRLIDYVQLSGPNSIRDLTAEILNGWDTVVQDKIDTGYNNQWDTNLINGVPNGFASQYTVSQGNGSPTWSSSLWGKDQQMAYDQMNAFLVFTMGSSAFTLTYPGYVPHPDQIAAAKMTNAMQMAYTPTATVVQDIVWQANDPLVHYMTSDLNNPAAGNGLQRYLNWPGNLGKLNYQRYKPWGVLSTDPDAYNFAIKDPLVYSSDYWDFPTNKFPTVGWLGRVHRGTPWQTVFLKATNILANANGLAIWMNRTGNLNTNDAMFAAPAQDRLLFDLFTTAFNDNATRGTLSVNVGAPNGPSLAAWSALFSGIVVPPVSATNTYSVIPPAGVNGTNSALWQLANAINQRRATFTNVDGLVGSFEHVGDILSVPQLTEQSPFLNLANVNYNSDEMYEWLPQQTLSLLRVSGSPRYVIYCYGQALKPAPNSVYTGGGQFFGMVTNYQVVSEIATRAVVRFNSAMTNVVTFTNDAFGNPIWFAAPVVTNNNAVIERFNILPPD